MQTPEAVLAVDPGKGGGFALWDEAGITLTKFTTEAEFLDLVAAMTDAARYVEAVVEDVPCFVSAVTSGASSFKLGYNFGFEVGVLRAQRVPVNLVKPRAWQAGLPGLKPNMPNRKRALVDIGRRLYPDQKGITYMTADALLILHWHLDKVFRASVETSVETR